MSSNEITGRPSNFQHAYLKTERANQHIQKLHSLITPLDPGLYRLGWVKGTPLPAAFHFGGLDDDPDLGQLIYQPAAPIAEIFSLIIGDAVHNIRSALDYAATAVVRAAKGDTSFVTFPFHEERERLVAGQSAGLRAIQVALPNADVEEFFREVIRPYRDGNFPLWAITKLDKIDKHNALIPNVTAVEVSARRMLAGTGGAFDCGVHFEVHQSVAIFTGTADPTKEKDNVEVAVNVTFPKDNLFGNKPVVPTLLDLAKVAVEALKAFDSFVSKAKA